MTFAVLIEPSDTNYTASIAGVPGLRTTADTREKAIADLKEMIAERLRLGELTTLEVESSLTPPETPSLGETSNGGELPGWCDVYRGLTDAELHDLEDVILDRGDLSRPN